MKSLKLIPLLDSIPKVNSYSNYGNILEKIFKMNSLKYLIHSLKFKQDYLKQLTSETSNKINTNEEYDVFDRQINQKKFEEEEQVDIFSLPTSKSEAKLKIKKDNFKSFCFHKKNSGEFDTSSLAYKYNPNFNSIYKNIPSVKIYKPIFQKSKTNKDILFHTEIKNNFSRGDNSSKKDKDKIKKNSEEKNNEKDNKYLNTFNNYKNFKYQTNLKNKKIKYRNKTQNTLSNKSNSKSHKSLDSTNRFITEISIKKIKKSHNTKISLNKLPNLLNQKAEEKNEKNTTTNSTENINKINTIPFHFKNRAIDFTKMRSRKALIYKNSLLIPNFGYYEPKYNLVEKRQYDIFFNKKPESDKYKQKKNLLKKILTSYDVESNYQTIDNNKLNNDILKRYKLIK